MSLRSSYFPFPPLFSCILSLKIFFHTQLSHTLNLYSSLKTKIDYHAPIKSRDIINGFYTLCFTSSGRERKEKGGKNSKLSFLFPIGTFVIVIYKYPKRVTVPNSGRKPTR